MAREFQDLNTLAASLQNDLALKGATSFFTGR